MLRVHNGFEWNPANSLVCHPSLQVYDEHYFQVTVDDLTPEATPLSQVCHADSPGILPVQWCMKNGVGLERPRAYPSQDFDWADYLKHRGAEAAPDSCFPDVSPLFLLLLPLSLLFLYLILFYFLSLCSRRVVPHNGDTHHTLYSYC